MDAIEDVEVNTSDSHDSSNAPSTIADTKKANDSVKSTGNHKGDIESSGTKEDRLPDLEQAPPSSSVTKIVAEHDVTEDVKPTFVENDMTEDVKLIDEWRSKRPTGPNI